MCMSIYLNFTTFIINFICKNVSKSLKAFCLNCSLLIFHIFRAMLIIDLLFDFQFNIRLEVTIVNSKKIKYY